MPVAIPMERFLLFEFFNCHWITATSHLIQNKLNYVWLLQGLRFTNEYCWIRCLWIERSFLYATNCRQSIFEAIASPRPTHIALATVFFTVCSVCLYLFKPKQPDNHVSMMNLKFIVHNSVHCTLAYDELFIHYIWNSCRYENNKKKWDERKNKRMSRNIGLCLKHIHACILRIVDCGLWILLSQQVSVSCANCKWKQMFTKY